MENYKKIYVAGFIFTIDAEDYPKIVGRHLSVLSGRDGKHHYLKVSGKFYHHIIMGKPPKGYIVDHIDSNSRNNRKSNLQIITARENNHKGRYNNACGFRGIYFDKKHKKYCARICNLDKRHFLGRYVTLKEAKKARIEAEKHFWGRQYTGKKKTRFN